MCNLQLSFSGTDLEMRLVISVSCSDRVLSKFPLKKHLLRHNIVVIAIKFLHRTLMVLKLQSTSCLTWRISSHFYNTCPGAPAPAVSPAFLPFSLGVLGFPLSKENTKRIISHVRRFIMGCTFGNVPIGVNIFRVNAAQLTFNNVVTI